MEYTLFILVSISVLLYLLIILNTLMLVKENRRLKIMPYLVIKKTNMLSGIKDIKNERTVVELFSEDNFKQKNIECINIGRGPAIDIKVKWSFDIKKFIELIAKVDKRKSLRISYGYRHITIDVRFPKDKYPGLPKDTSIGFSENDLGQINFILQTTRYSRPVKIEICKIYLMLLTLYFNLLQVNSIPLTDEAISAIPECSLELSYQDLEGFEYLQEILMKNGLTLSDYGVTFNSMDNNLQKK